jgi:hypothetical protein
MTIRAVASDTQGEAHDNEAVSPMAIIRQGTIREITEPQPVHTKIDARTLEREGVAATDYFFQGQDPTVHEEMIGEKKQEA